VTGSCTSGAGLTTRATPITIKIDKTPPSATLAVTSHARLERLVHVRRHRPDDGQRHLEARQLSVTGYSTAVGPHTLTARATDNAGNVSMATGSYTMLASRFAGFYSPVDMDTATEPVVNVVKHGSTVPLKFEVFAGDTELTDTSAVVAGWDQGRLAKILAFLRRPLPPFGLR
jgi:hypothetical protein